MPAYEKTRFEMAFIASANDGLPNRTRSLSHGPVCGASDGRPPTATAMVTSMMETIIETRPTCETRSESQGRARGRVRGTSGRGRTHPADPANVAHGAHRGERKRDDRSDGDKDGGAGRVERHGVEGGRDAEESRAGDAGHDWW